MDASYSTVELTDDGKLLLVFLANLQGNDPVTLPAQAKGIWRELAPFIKRKRQTLIIRDIPEAAIEGTYPGGYSQNAHESFVAVPKWPTDEEPFVDSIAHELHHLARWQNGGYGQTLGRALVTEGMACWFAEMQSGWQAPWIQGDAPAKVTLQQVEKEWGNGSYNHPEWFFEGPLGKWVGYRTGYWLAKRMLDDTFDLEKSVLADELVARRFLTD